MTVVFRMAASGLLESVIVDGRIVMNAVYDRHRILEVIEFPLSRKRVRFEYKKLDESKPEQILDDILLSSIELDGRKAFLFDYSFSDQNLAVVIKKNLHEINRERSFSWDLATGRVTGVDYNLFSVDGKKTRLTSPSISKIDSRTGLRDLWYVDRVRGLERDQIDSGPIVETHYLKGGPANGRVSKVLQYPSNNVNEKKIIYSASFDSLGRLKRETGSNGTWRYEYHNNEFEGPYADAFKNGKLEFRKFYDPISDKIKKVIYHDGRILVFNAYRDGNDYVTMTKGDLTVALEVDPEGRILRVANTNTK